MPVSAASPGEDDGPNDPGSHGQVRPPPLRGVATGWLKGGAPGGQRKLTRGEVRERGANARVVLDRSPLPEARRPGSKIAAAGAPASAVTRLSEGVRRAPAIPFGSEGPN